MLKKCTFPGSLAVVGLLLGNTADIAAAMTTQHSAAQGKFEQLEQPLATKIGVTAAALFLIGLELWWFLLSKRRNSLK